MYRRERKATVYRGAKGRRASRKCFGASVRRYRNTNSSEVENDTFGNIEEWRARVMQAAIGYEARWSELRLWVVDPGPGAAVEAAARVVSGGMRRRQAGRGRRARGGDVSGLRCGSQRRSRTLMPMRTPIRSGSDHGPGLAVAIGVRKAGAARLVEDFELGETRNLAVPRRGRDPAGAGRGAQADRRDQAAVAGRGNQTMLGEQPINQFDQPIPADAKQRSKTHEHPHTTAADEACRESTNWHCGCCWRPTVRPSKPTTGVLPPIGRRRSFRVFSPSQRLSSSSSTGGRHENPDCRNGTRLWR